nr:unnamed protein product [Callosobruchus analis]
MRVSITPLEMLAITIRYLGSGCDQLDLHSSYRIGHTTIGKIVRKVCKAIWETLRETSFPPLTEERWKQISEGFEKHTQFPNCLGAVDGKHVRIRKPKMSGSLFHNYKNYFSVVLLAIADSNYEFIYIDVGAFGKDSDKKWKITIYIFQKVPGTEMPNIPLMFIGDEAFSLSKHAMRPFSGKVLSEKKRIFNYRLSRARRNVESAFGILSNKWKLFHKAINVDAFLIQKVRQEPRDHQFNIHKQETCWPTILCQMLEVCLGKINVFAVGFNLYKQFDNDQTILGEFTKVFTGTDIRDICINHSFSVIHVNSNKVRIYPRNQTIAIGSEILNICCTNDRLLILGKCNKVHKLDFQDLTGDVAILKEIPMGANNIKNIACGLKLIVFYTTTGNLFNTFEKLQFESHRIIDLKCGRDHCLILDNNGTVYTFGRGSRGQLGHGTLNDESEPVLVDALAGLKIIQISAGGWHSCAVSKDGDLYTWGWNGSGQLGACDKTETQYQVLATPTPVNFNENVLKVACGSRHTIALLENKEVYGCGWNKYRQIKNCEQELFNTFVKMRSFENEDIIDIKCGPWNSVVLCT